MELHTSNGEMQGSFLNPSPQPSSLQQQQQQIPNGHHHQISSDPQINQFDPSSPHDEFLEQMLSSLPSYSWPPPADDQFQTQFDDSPSSLLATKLRQNQISGGAGGSSSAAALTLQQQLLLSRGGISGDDSGLIPLPLSLDASSGDSSCDYRLLLDRSRNDGVDVSSFKPPNPGGEGSMQALFNGFTAGSLHGTTPHSTPNQTPHFRHSQSQNKAAPAAMNQPAAAGSAGGPAPAQPRQRVRARRGQATDPHSIAERLRRERIAERMKALQELVPNANKTDKASMLDEIIDYVKFIQLQVKVLSMSRLGGAAAVAPLMAGLSSERGGDRVQPGAGGPNGTAAQRSSSNGGGGGGGDSLTVTEQRVAKLMEEDMGSAMQYLQGKGLCLMPISLATAISTATCHPSAAARNSGAGDLPSSPNVSVLSVQSAPAGTNGTVDASVSKA